MSTLRYRADIDGLRAIAVLAVVVFHAWPGLLPGGFVGVDVFFVLSGYLISGIIYKGCGDGTFSFADFYGRRVRRIVPSLVAMLALCLAYGWLVLFPSEFRRLGAHVAWGGVFLQNVGFWLESGYFDTSAALEPILHLWSLAVEEQVYLVFPPVVLVAWRLRRPMLPVLAGLLVASLAACLVATRLEPSAAFFLTPFRAWEFLVGSILAWIHDRRGVPAVRSWTAEAASWCGIAILGSGFAWIAGGDPFPGWRAAMPVAGTALVIAAGTGATANRWLLSLKPVVWVGLISYPLYLFHWPLLSFLHVLKGPKPDAGLVLGAVGLSFILAAAAYVGLERRIRPSRWKGTVPALLAAFVGLGALGLGVATGVVPARPMSEAAMLVNEAISENTNGGPPYFEGYRTVVREGIVIGRAGGEERQTLCFGDSTIMMVAPRIQKLIEDADAGARGAVFVAGAGLCPIPGATNPAMPSQERLARAMEEEIAANPAIDRVVIGGLWNHFFSPWTSWAISSEAMGTEGGRAKGLAALGGLIARLEASGKRVYLILPPPQHESLDPRTIYRRRLLGGGAMRVEPYTTEACERRSRFSRLEEVVAVAVANGAEVIDPVPSLSRDGTCIAVDGNGPVRFDNLHLRYGFARHHATYIDRTMLEEPGDRPGRLSPREGDHERPEAPTVPRPSATGPGSGRRCDRGRARTPAGSGSGTHRS